MLYHFYITIHWPEPLSNAIWRIRSYESAELSETDSKNLQYVMDQAVQARGLATGIGQIGAYVSTSYPSWEKSISPYTADDEFKTHDARAIAQQMLSDLEAIDDGKKLFSDTGTPFARLDFNKFSYIDETTNNDNLKVAIGTKVYVRGERDKKYTYQGRPNNDQIRNNQTIIKVRTKVWATDSNVIAVDDFDKNDYADQIEVFPLPSNGPATKGIGNNKYFSRTKTTYQRFIEGAGTFEWRDEELGKTEEEAQTRLALELAFNDIVEPETGVGESNTRDLIPI